MNLNVYRKLKQMKPNFSILTIIYIIFISFSCSEDGKNIGSTFFTRADFRDSVHVVLDTISVSDSILNPVAFYVVRDSLLLVRNSQHSSFLVEIHNLKTKELITKTGPWGRGPLEVLGGFVYYRSDGSLFIIHDMVSRRFQVYNIDSLLKYKSAYEPIIQNTPPEAVDIALFDNDRFVYYDWRYIETRKFSNGVNEIAIEHFDSNAKYQVKSFKYFVANLNGGKLYVSPDFSRIAVFSIYDDKINIYNHQLELLKTIKGPDNYVPEYNSQRNSSNTFKLKDFNKNWLGYGSGFSNNQYIYSVYKVSGKTRNYTEVFKFDWNGEPIKRYIINYSINTISINNGYIYATGYKTQRSEPKLVRFAL